MKTAEDVTKSIQGMARIARYEIDGETIAFYAKVLLRSLTPDQACDAIARWCAENASWAPPAKIIELIKPRRSATDAANELATKLRALIARRGYTWTSTYRYDGHASIEDAVRAEAGDAGLAVVQRCGGWAAFCREWGGSEGDASTRAQLRGMCEAIGKTGGEATAYLGEREQALLEAASEDTFDDAIEDNCE